MSASMSNGHEESDNGIGWDGKEHWKRLQQPALERMNFLITENGRLDATNPEALDALAEGNVTIAGFNVIIMNMAIMDVSATEPPAAALFKLLKKGRYISLRLWSASFVATLLHPVFFTCGAQRSIQTVDGEPDSYPEIIRAKTIKEYLDVPPYYGAALHGQQAQQLFSTVFKISLVMDAMEVPAITPQDAMPERLEASSNYTQVPALLAFRCGGSSKIR
ncbi:S-adenosyl-L-methionine-dependent methyltransferase [Xylaria castorea]|nr:S-adenosyl-L-methionine-dependent methyltransferase [Xylaria castorea]